MNGFKNLRPIFHDIKLAIGFSVILLLGFSCFLLLAHTSPWSWFLFTHPLFYSYPSWLQNILYIFSDINYTIYKSVGLYGHILSPILGAPILEEIEFRSLILLSAKRASLKTKICLSILTSLIFAMCHGVPIGFMSVIFCMGLISCWLINSTKRLWPSMIFHSMYNTIVTVVGSI